tara:strand:+ start:80 stop:433 length:354 start_codon:yes stop_codon:yes gene_type:complete
MNKSAMVEGRPLHVKRSTRERKEGEAAAAKEKEGGKARDMGRVEKEGRGKEGETKKNTKKKKKKKKNNMLRPRAMKRKAKITTNASSSSSSSSSNGGGKREEDAPKGNDYFRSLMSS